MRQFLLAAMFAATAVLPAHAQDNPRDDTRFRQIGECMAYYAVSSNMDGKKDVPPEVANLLSVLTGELMFEASVLGYDDDKAQTFVVNKLVEMNTLVKESGSVALDASNSGMCAALAASIMSPAK